MDGIRVCCWDIGLVGINIKFLQVNVHVGPKPEGDGENGLKLYVAVEMGF